MPDLAIDLLRESPAERGHPVSSNSALPRQSVEPLFQIATYSRFETAGGFNLIVKTTICQRTFRTLGDVLKIFPEPKTWFYGTLSKSS